MQLFAYFALVSLAVPPSSAAAASLNSRVDSRPLYRSSTLRISGRDLVSPDGQLVKLHGINLGGWLVTEGWMCGIVDASDTLVANGSSGVAGRSSWESLEQRFGVAGASALIALWQDHWITTADLDRIHDSGFNLIRVPISYRTLQHADGSWILDAHGQIDFSRMDWIVREAAERGIYTIFDLHVWPSQRTAYDRIGRPEGAPTRAAMATLWAVIADHYRGNGAIAAFDLINEFPGNWGVQQQLSRAVSKADPHRIQVIEGFTFAEFLKLHAAGTFPNSIFSDHFYEAEPLDTAKIEERLKESAESPVPVYIGEFLAADFATATKAMTNVGVSWSSWTYKTVDMGDWGAFNYTPDLKIDLQKDSYQTITSKWANPLTQWQYPDQPKNYSVNHQRLDEGGGVIADPFSK